MKAIEVIIELQKMIDQHGDLDTKIETEVSYEDVYIKVRENALHKRFFVFEL